MEKELLKLAASGDQNGVNKLLPTVQLKVVLKHLHTEAVRGSDVFLPSLRAILQGSQGSGEEASKCRFATYQFGLNLLRRVDLPLRLASEVVGLLLVETDSFTSCRLAEVAAVFMDSVRRGEDVQSKWLEVFPKVLMTLSSRATVPYGNEILSGPDCKSRAVSEILSSRWSPNMALHLSATFRDLPLGQEELTQVISKVLDTMPEVDLDETPSLVYELLLLAGKGHRGQVLEGIVEFFRKKDEHCRRDTGELPVPTSETLETLLQAEGTVMLHVSFASKQDQELGKEFLRLLKVYKCNLRYVLSPFCLSLALALTRIQRFRQQILDLLKGSVLRSFRESERRKSSWWMRETAPDRHDPPSDALLTVVHNSKHGWDHVTQGLLQLALELLDAPRVNSKDSFLEDAGTLGMELLQQLFKAHSFVRSMILDQVLNKRIVQSGATAKHYVEALASIVGSSPHPTSFEMVRGALEYLPFLPHASAQPLLLALMPLFKVSPALRDTLILVVRKSLFRRDVEARKVAVSSFLAIVKTHRILGGIPLSQGSCSSQVTVESSGGNGASSSNEALCLELLGILRRALTQQAEVRQTLYQGLAEVLEKNSQLSEPVLELLAEQLQKYCSSEDVGPPLKLDACIRVEMDTPQILEPLAHLLQASCRCVERSGESSQQGEKLRRLLRTLVGNTAEAELEDFELDKSSDYGNGVAGQRNRLQAEILLGVYEALMEFAILSGDFSERICRDVLSLFKGRQKVWTLLKDSYKKDEKKSKTPPGSILSLRTLARLLDDLFCKDEPSEGAHLLRDCPEFLQHVSSAVVLQVQQHKDCASDCVRSCTDFATVGRALLKRCKEDAADQQILDTLAEIVSLYSRRSENLLRRLIAAISGQEASEGNVVVVQFVQNILAMLDCEIEKPKEALALIGMVRTLAGQLPQGCTKEAYDTVRALCVRHELGDGQVARALLDVVMTFGRRDKTWTGLLREVSFSVRKALGDIEEDNTVEGESPLAAVGPKTAAAVVAPLLRHVEYGLEEIGWAVDLPDSGVAREHAICSRFGRLTAVCKELVRTAHPLGPNQDLVLKTLARFYTVCAALARHYLSMYVSKTGHLYTNFEKLVKLLGTELTPNVYHLLTYIQVSQSEAAPKKTLDSAAEKARVLRESRTIPTLIFAIEQYEQCLIRLGKKSKVNLMAHVKLSTSRDFRINIDQVQVALETPQEPAEAEEPRPKRPRNRLARKN